MEKDTQIYVSLGNTLVSCIECKDYFLYLALDEDGERLN